MVGGGESLKEGVDAGKALAERRLVGGEVDHCVPLEDGDRATHDQVLAAVVGIDVQVSSLGCDERVMPGKFLAGFNGFGGGHGGRGLRMWGGPSEPPLGHRLQVAKDFGWHGLTRVGIAGVDFVFVAASVERAPPTSVAEDDAVVLKGAEGKAG